METQSLRPRREKIEIIGKLSYSEGIGAWNIIRFKKELIAEFPQLREKIAFFGYRMVFFHEFSNLEKHVRKLKREKDAVPILMWLVKEKK